jgi:hypothetical protein
MKETIIDWFLDRQLKIALGLGAICLAVIFIFDFRGFQAILSFLISLVFIFLGQKFYTRESTETWLIFSYSETIRKILGGVFLFIGWSIFLRNIFALAIASLFLKTI